jgi:hypothetical protein
LILTTGSSDKEDLTGIKRLDNAHLLEKPVDFAELLDLILNIAGQMDKKRLTAPGQSA